MVRKRTGSAAPDGAVDAGDEDLPEEIDPLADDADAMTAPEPEAPVPDGHLKVKMKGQWRDNGASEWKPPGVYVMPKAEALHYVKTGAAEVKA